MVLERPRHHVTVGAARVAEACASRVTTREGRDTVLSSFCFPLPFVVLDCVGSMTGRDAHCDWRVEATCNLRFPSRECFRATHSVDAEGTTNHLFEMGYPWFFCVGGSAFAGPVSCARPFFVTLDFRCGESRFGQSPTSCVKLRWRTTPDRPLLWCF